MLAVLGPIPAKPKVYVRAEKKNVCRYFQEKEKIFLRISLILKSYMDGHNRIIRKPLWQLENKTNAYILLFP